MKITYDEVADVIYIYLIPEAEDGKNKGIVVETRGEYPINLDFTKDERLVGNEILHVSKMINLDYLKKLRFKKIG